jgi:hypothetical protein
MFTLCIFKAGAFVSQQDNLFFWQALAIGAVDRDNNGTIFFIKSGNTVVFDSTQVDDDVVHKLNNNR